MSGIPRRVSVLMACLLQWTGAHAETEEPAKSPKQTYVQSVYSSYFVPRAARFVLASGKLADAVDPMCRAPVEDSLGAARRAWIDALLAWESLGAVAVGPLLERHTVANIDFWPTRPGMIEAEMRQETPDTAMLRRSGVAGRGLPALEWLLWGPAAPAPVIVDPKACKYAFLLAQDVAEEARALDMRFAELGASVLPSETAGEMLTQLVNQSIGAVELLRRKRFLNPAMTRNPKAFARSLSGQTQASWNVQWGAIRGLLIGEGKSDAWTLVALLRERGLNASAVRLRAAVDQSSAAVRMASPAKPQSALDAAAALLNLRSTLERDVAAPLGVPVVFSEFDGD